MVVSLLILKLLLIILPHTIDHTIDHAIEHIIVYTIAIEHMIHLLLLKRFCYNATVTLYIYVYYVIALAVLWAGAINYKVAAGCIKSVKKGRETICTPSNLRSQEFGSSATPAYVLVVVCFIVGFTGLANLRADADSKASGAKFWWHFIFYMIMN